MNGLSLLLFSFLAIHSSWISLKGQRLQVEVAENSMDKRRGLMGRTFLKDTEGMLFVYGEERILTFWMKGTKIPLSIGFFDQNQKLLEVQEMSVPSEGKKVVVYESRRPARYALEMPQGWFAKYNVEIGDRFSYLPVSTECP